MAIYQPYFYIIQDVRNGMYYAGAKWGKDANPVAFMIEGGYKTSSGIINELIQQHGLSNFIVRKIRTFETGEAAHDYETRFLRKVDARRHPKFYNGHNNDGTFDFSIRIAIMNEVYGVDYPFQSPKIQEKVKHTVKNKHNVENISQLPEVKAKKLKTRKKTERAMGDKGLKKHREKTNKNISIAHNSRSLDEKEKSIEKFKTTLSNTPDHIRKDRIERGKASKKIRQDEIAEKWKETYSNRTPKKCDHCGLETMNYSNFTRWHGENCKHKE